jgi:hypothetical protein
LLLFNKQQQDLESLQFTITYKAALLDRSNTTEVQEFNELLKEYNRVLTWSLPELPEQEIKKKLSAMDEFSKFKEKIRIRNFERAE